MDWRAALHQKKCPCQCRLSATQDHRPLRAQAPTTTDGGGELKQSGKYGQNAEYAQHPVRSQCDNHSNRSNGTDDDVDGLGRIFSQSTAMRRVDVIGQRIPCGIHDQQCNCAGREVLADGESKYDPDSGKRSTDKIVAREPAFVLSSSDIFMAINHCNSLTDFNERAEGKDRTGHAYVASVK